MKVFITGGAGFIGSHTVDECVRDGHTVTVYDLKPWALASNLHGQEGAITYIEGDILNKEQLEASMKGHTHILHLAAIVSVGESIRDPFTSHMVNVTGTINVFEAARHLGITRVVYASSAAVYGNQDTVPIVEEASLAPQSPYGTQKAINDIYARLYTDLYSCSFLGLRYFNAFGPRQDPHSPYSGVISIFSERIRTAMPVTIYGDGTITRDFVSVHDIAAANVLALASNTTGVCNIGSGKECSLHELLTHFESIQGCSVERFLEAPRQGDIARSCASIERATALLGFMPRVTLEHGLAELMTS